VPTLVKIFSAILILLFGVVVFPSTLWAACADGQVDINTGSAEELDLIKWVGPATAASIIAARPFSSVDDLIRVSGIGETKLADIKAEGIACVGDSTESSPPVPEPEPVLDPAPDADPEPAPEPELEASPVSEEEPEEEGCVDVNKDSAEDLTRLSGVGEVIAGRIAAARPFYSVDDLGRVRGIGEGTISDIEAQRIVCAAFPDAPQTTETPLAQNEEAESSIPPAGSSSDEAISAPAAEKKSSAPFLARIFGDESDNDESPMQEKDNEIALAAAAASEEADKDRRAAGNVLLWVIIAILFASLVVSVYFHVLRARAPK
jgi:DNA uptake protein ComE-like DNA-binding protein